MLEKYHLEALDSDISRFYFSKRLKTYSNGLHLMHSKYHFQNKVGCVLTMVTVALLLHAEFGPNDHRKDAPHFI